MLFQIVLWWMAVQMNAPIWIYGLLGASVLLNLINFGLKMFQKGKESQS